MHTILFISQTTGFENDKTNAYCGVGLRGKLTSDILLKECSLKYNFVREFLDSNKELEVAILKHQPSVIIYNYHIVTTIWANDTSLREKYKNIKHIMIHYDYSQEYIDNFNRKANHGFNYIITDNNTLSADNKHVFLVTRSIPYADILNDSSNNDCSDNAIPKIGFQGFGGDNKQLPYLAKQVQSEFDEAIIRLHIPYSYYGDPDGKIARQNVEEVESVITKPGIKVEVSHDFLSDEEIIRWLNKNTINCYFYKYLLGAGLASSPDYAIAARKPIAVTNSCMLKHLNNLEPTIEIEKSRLKEIIANGIAPLIPIYEKYSQANVLSDYEKICEYVISCEDEFFLDDEEHDRKANTSIKTNIASLMPIRRMFKR